MGYSKTPWVPTTFIDTFSDIAPIDLNVRQVTFITPYPVTPCTITSWRVVVAFDSILPVVTPFDFSFRTVSNRVLQTGDAPAPLGARLFGLPLFVPITHDEQLGVDVTVPGQYLQLVVTAPSVGDFSARVWVSVNVLPWRSDRKPDLRRRSEDRKMTAITGASVLPDGVFSTVLPTRFIRFPFIIRSFWFYNRSLPLNEITYQLAISRDRDFSISHQDSTKPVVLGSPVFRDFGMPRQVPNLRFPITEHAFFPAQWVEVRPWHNVFDYPVSIKVYSHKVGSQAAVSDWILALERLSVRSSWVNMFGRPGFSFDDFSKDPLIDLILDGVLSLEDLSKLVAWEILVRGALARVTTLLGVRIPNWPVFEKPTDAKFRMRQISDIHQFFIKLLQIMGIPLKNATPGLLVTGIGPTPLEMAGVVIKQWVLDVVLESYRIVQNVMTEANHADEVIRPTLPPPFPPDGG